METVSVAFGTLQWRAKWISQGGMSGDMGGAMGCLGAEGIMGCRDEAWRGIMVLGDFVKVVSKGAVASRSDFSMKLELPAATRKKVPLEHSRSLCGGKHLGLR